MDKEKRKLNRVKFKSIAEINYNNYIIKGDIENLNINGMLVKTKDEVDIGSVVDVKITLSGTTSELSIKIKAEIIRREKDGFAVKFAEMELDSFVHLRNIVFYADEELHEYYEFM